MRANRYDYEAVAELGERISRALSESEHGEASRQLQDALEELAVAHEELRLQNEALEEARLRAEREQARYAGLFEFSPEPYFLTSDDGRIMEANRPAAELLGVPIEQLMRKPLIVFVPFEGRHAFRSMLNEIGRVGRVKDRIVPVSPRQGPRRYVSVNIALRGDHEGGLHWAMRDVTQAVDHDRALRELEAELEERVRDRTAELEAQLAAKDEFLGMVSHELRTPLTTMMGNAEVLSRQSRLLTEEDRKGALADISSEGARLLRLIDDMLLLARIESQVQELEPLLPVHIVKTFAERASPQLNRQISVHAGNDLPAAAGEPTFVEQILQNLVSNAAKFTTDGIDIEISSDAENVLFAVGDRGPGVPEEELPHLFDPFYRATSTSHLAAGHGLGLAVARRLVQAQGGRIWAEPRPGGGTLVMFTLPIYPTWA